MAVRRIVRDVATPDPAATAAFYRELFDLETAMDLGWIVTLATPGAGPIQISLASEGGSGAPVPEISIEVDDLEEVYRRAVAGGHEIVYELADEPWGVRRFFVRDPAGQLVNVLSHATQP